MSISQEEYWKIQVRNAEYKLALKKRANIKMKTRLETMKNCTTKMVKFLEQGQESQAFELLINMNLHLTNETECLEKVQNISCKYHNVIENTIGVLTCKDTKTGDARTPEMAKFKMLMTSHCQMHTIHSWKHYHKYSQNWKTKKDDITD